MKYSLIIIHLCFYDEWNYRFSCGWVLKNMNFSIIFGSNISIKKVNKKLSFVEKIIIDEHIKWTLEVESWLNT